MFCTHCGEKIQPGSTYCPKCGKKMLKANWFHTITAKYLKPITGAYANYIKPRQDFLIKTISIVVSTAAILFCITQIFIPAYGEKMLNDGRRFFESENYEEAVTAFSQAASIVPETAEVYTYLGEAYFNLNDYENARKALDEASKEEATPNALKLLADVCLYEGDEPMYESTLTRLMQQTPNDPYAYIRLSEQYIKTGRFDNAAYTLENLLNRQSNGEATKLLYSVYLESYANNTAVQKAGEIKADAYKYLREIIRTPLDINGDKAVSVSPTGKYILVKSDQAGAAFMDIYSLNTVGYKFYASFKIPHNYLIDTGMIAWSGDETMLAFYNSKGEAFIHDSSIYIYELAFQKLYNVTDPGADYNLYMTDEGVYIIDSIPCFSQDSKQLYFARQTIKGNSLSVVDVATKEITNLFEPSDGAWVDYKIIERNTKIYFSVRGQNNSPTSGLYVYEQGSAGKLNFQFDERYYDLALKDVSSDGNFLLYYITTASQNDSLYFKVLDLNKMELVDLYKQDIDLVNNKLSAINIVNLFGQRQVFICRNSGFSLDGKSIILAEDGGVFSGKTIRKINLESGVTTFEYLSFEDQGADKYCVATGNKGGDYFRQMLDGTYLVNEGQMMFVQTKMKN